MAIHTKPKIKFNRALPAISYALISAITPVISILSTSSALATQASLSKNFTFAVEVSDTPTLTMVLSDSKLSLGLTPGMASNTFGSGDLKVTVGTSNNAGYTLTMTADSSTLSSTSGSTIPSLVPRTNGYTENEFTTNSWGLKRHNGIYADTNYRDIPGTDELPVNSYNYAIDPTSNPSDPNYPNSTATITFATKVDKTLPAGEYKADLTFKATANVVASTCMGKTICYNDNGANSPTTMANQTTVSDADKANEQDNNTIESGDKVTLWASNYQYQDHGFLGWMTTPSPEPDTKYYGPNETITADGALEGSGLTLYANWLPVSTRYTMQTFTSAVCENELTPASYNTATGVMTVSPSTFIALKDERDNNTYAIARLADGNCWMTENLRLADSELTVNNTHNPSLPLTQSDGTSTANQLSATSDSWCTMNNATCHDKSMLNTTATTSTINESSDSASNIYSYGNYYNWHSATAGNGRNTTVNGETLAQNMSTVGDICPTNWRLPMGGAFPNTTMQDANGAYGTETTNNTANSDYYKLFYGMLGQTPNVVHPTYKYYTYYGDVATANAYQAASTIGTTASQLARKYPNDFIYSGYWLGSSAGHRSALGYYWSSTTYNTSSAYYLRFGSASLVPGTGDDNKFYGFPVRCLAGN